MIIEDAENIGVIIHAEYPLGDERTLCGIATDCCQGSTFAEGFGKVTCKSCLILVRYCKSLKERQLT